MIVDEPNMKIAEVLRKDWPQIKENCEAGRVVYIIADETHKEGWWALLQEFAQIANTVIKERHPAHARILFVYDQTKPAVVSGEEQ